MFEEMLGSFMSSTQGQKAAQALGARGIGQGQIQQILSAAFPAATSSLRDQTSAKSPGGQALGMFDLLGGHPGQAFLIGAATSAMRGEGPMDAAQDGAMSVVGSHVAEVIASRVGLDRQTAGQAAAAITPFLAGFIHEHLSGQPEVTAQRGAARGTWQEQYAAKHGAMPMPQGQGKPMPQDQQRQQQGYGKPMPQDQQDQQQGYGKPMPQDQQGQQQGYGKPMPQDQQGQQQGYGKPMPQDQQGYGKPMPQGKPNPNQNFNK